MERLSIFWAKIKTPTAKTIGEFSLKLLALLQVELLVELVNTTAAVNKLLLTGEERVALRADFHLNILLCGTGFNYVAAGTFNGSGLVIGMDSLFHYVTAFSHIVKPWGSNPTAIYRENYYSICLGDYQGEIFKSADFLAAYPLRIALASRFVGFKNQIFESDFYSCHIAIFKNSAVHFLKAGNIA